VKTHRKEFLSERRKGWTDARRSFSVTYGGIFPGFHWLRTVLRPPSLREKAQKAMNIESILMLIVTICTGVYLLYALLRPERF
jgi:K+-transporting ATPase KdpF subunit